MRLTATNQPHILEIWNKVSTSSIPSYPTLTSTADVAIMGESNGASGSASLSGALAQADLNFDGKKDLVVGEGQGQKVYVFYNDGTYPASPNNADQTYTGENDYDYFGNAVGLARTPNARFVFLSCDISSRGH